VIEPAYTPDRIESRLLSLAAVFLLLYSLLLTLSPALPVQSWQVAYRWDHWLGMAVWLVLVFVLHRETSRLVLDRDPFLLPAAALLSGWGMLTVWRLFPEFGLRQAVWLVVSALAYLLLLRQPSHLAFLRRYKYLWLTGGLFLTGLTLLVGANPSGFGARLWLNLFGLYFQPSEPLKLLLVIYLAAYLAGANGKDSAAPIFQLSSSLLPLLAPTLLLAGIAMLLLIFQRDLGTASIFLFLYTATVYIASSRKAILVFAGVTLPLVAVAGYLMFDVVRIRVEAWLNPWTDPSGRSYQLVQSLMAVANGGLFGRGPGMGSPRVVPVPHSDFIYTAIIEEGGLVAGIALLAVLGLIAGRGFIASMRAPDSFRRYLAAGLTTFLVAQSVLIIGGNLRLLPLTGVTLPFVSYGGSSLLTSFIALAILVHISSRSESDPAPLPNPRPYLFLFGILLAGLAASAFLTAWWSVVRAPDLLLRTDNPRRSIADRYVPRGSIVDRLEETVVETSGLLGTYTRTVYYPDLSPVVGYNHQVYGQAGLEASLDPTLRGQVGYPDEILWWHQLVFGRSPPGLSVQLTIDLRIQLSADQALAGSRGAVVALDPISGDILALASHPNFDPNRLEETWEDLIQNEGAPLLNRATQGLYQPGPALGPFFLAAALDKSISSGLPDLPGQLSYRPPDDPGGLTLSCALPPERALWGEVIAAGCPQPVLRLEEHLSGLPPLQIQSTSRPVSVLYQRWGFDQSPALYLPSANPLLTPGFSPREDSLPWDIQVTPVQMALAAAGLSNQGVRPAARLVHALREPGGSWTILPAAGGAQTIFDPTAASQAAAALAVGESAWWHAAAVAPNGPNEFASWFLAGSLPGRAAAATTVVVVLEGNDPDRAVEIGSAVMDAARLR
jgi:cell division protein FtsW (lipid II flippase)